MTWSDKIKTAVCSATLAGSSLFASPLERIFPELRALAQDPKAALTFFFPQTSQELVAQKERVLEYVAAERTGLLAIPADERTFANTLQPVGDILGAISFVAEHFLDIQMLYPDAQMRDVAGECYIALKACSTEQIKRSTPVYRAVQAYAEQGAHREQLTREQAYFLQDSLMKFRRQGLHLSEAEQAQATELTAQLLAQEVELETNVNNDASSILATAEELAGVPASRIAQLAQQEDGRYIVTVDYPTYGDVMRYCTVEDTRKRLYFAFSNRAYPINRDLFKEVLQKRHELAQLLGCERFAHYDLLGQMVETPEEIEAFLDDLLHKSQRKYAEDFATLMAHLPEGVELSQEGALHPWHSAFVGDNFLKKVYNFDAEKVAEYFPVESTMAGLFAIYEKFFDVTFSKEPAAWLWHDEIEMITVRRNRDNSLVGYILLDLYPRPNKFSHAACSGVIPAIKRTDGSTTPAVSVVMCNFPRATADKPALFKMRDVETFFHECGHALHGLFGATTIASWSGTETKMDFVELPSQMLEEWLSDPAILKMVGKHYITGQPLPDELIATMMELKQFGQAAMIVQQAGNAYLSLLAHTRGHEEDIHALAYEIHQRTGSRSTWQPDAHMYASFGHLMREYRSRYYCYLWSSVLALDVFSKIKEHGLLNPAIGAEYVEHILSKGGSDHPMNLLRNFLGREPSSDAFLQAHGLK